MLMPLVLYHGNCPDGFTAAWAMWRVFEADAEYREVYYGQAPPLADAVGRRVILVDFSYPRAALDALAKVARCVEVYDHHKTAEQDLRDWTGGKVVFDTERSGAGIAWDEFCRRAPRPRLIDYVEDRDLWRWALPQSREVNEYLFSWPRDFDTWNAMTYEFEYHIEDVRKQGATLLRAKRARVEKVCENVQWMRLAGFRIPIVNTAWDFSEIGEYLCEKFPEASCGGYYFDRADKRQWGLRSRGGFDVSALCTQYGGGGHTAAAGFTSGIGWVPPEAP